MKSGLKVVKNLTVGKRVLIRVLRAKQNITLTLVPSRWPEGLKINSGEVSMITELGISLAAMSKKVRQSFKIRWGAKGVLVSLVDPATAPHISLQRGDIIIQINQKEVWRPRQVVAAYQRAKQSKIRNLLLLVERAKSFRFMLLPIPLE